MLLVVEHIDHLAESFRLLAWDRSVARVEVIAPGDVRHSHRGVGERWHLHAEAELTLFERGQGTRLVGDSIAPMEGPELVLLGPHLPHCWNCRGESRGIALQFAIDRSQPLAALPEWQALESLWQRSGRGLLYPAEVASEVNEIVRGMFVSDRVERLAGFFQVLAILTRSRGEPLSQKPFTASDTSRHFESIQRVVREVLQNFDQPLEMAEMVALADMSRATFCREFKKSTGRSLVEFVNEVRIDAARQRLRLTSDPVSQIALETGFGNLSHFNRQFRRLVGMSPREWRG